ncbi:MAG TPA: hypothetical protein VHD35_18285 [Chitinophagaceae bacterium]|nr:hypothetical protein [Chitinophagaceae bacterium]
MDASVANMQKLSDVMKNYKGATGFQEQKVAANQLTDAFNGIINSQKEYDMILQRAVQVRSQYNGNSKEMLQLIIGEAKAQKELAQAMNIRDKASQSAQKTMLNERKIANDVSNDYKQLSLAYNEAALKAKNYILTLGANHPITVQAVADANAMGNKLKEIDASVGQYQRNVGNYNGAIGVLGKSLRGFGGLGIVLSKALGIDPTVTEGIRETGKAFIDLKHAEDIEKIAKTENAAAAEVNSTATQKAGVFQRLYTGIVGESTGAMKIFKLALAGIGVGLAIFGIVELVKYFNSLKTALSDAARYQGELNDVNDKAIEGYASQKIEIENLVARVKDENTSNSQKKEILQEVNDKYGDQFGKLKSVSDLETTFVNKAGDFVKALELKAKAQAAFNLAVDEEQKALKAQLEIDQKNAMISQGKTNVPSFFPEAFQRQGKRVTQIAVDNLTKDKEEAEKTKDDYLKIFDDLNNQLDAISKKNGFNFNHFFFQ